MPNSVKSDPDPDPASRTRTRIPGGSGVWWAASALSLVAGFVTLWNGSITLAPILLVAGYCVFVPIAILKR